MHRVESNSMSWLDSLFEHHLAGFPPPIQIAMISKTGLPIELLSHETYRRLSWKHPPSTRTLYCYLYWETKTFSFHHCRQSDLVKQLVLISVER